MRLERCDVGPLWPLDAFATAEEAEARRAKLEEMNPGQRFAVVEF